ncbi:MAG: tetratricopeptide repeat protein [Leptospirillia bacterium]
MNPDGQQAVSRTISRALSAYRKANWLQAVTLLKEVLAERPDATEASVHLARIYMDRQLFTLAKDVVSRAFCEAHVDDPETFCPLTDTQRILYLTKANLRLCQGDPEGALALYSLLFAECAHDPDLLFHMGLAYEKLAQHELAVAYLDRAIEANPKFIEAMEIKGQILLCLGHLPEALDLYRELSLRNPDDVNAYVMMGRIHHRLGQPLRAVAAWERAITLAPNADEPLHMLGRTALKAGDTIGARAYLIRAVAANPNNLEIHLDLAELLADLGETRAALGHWDEVAARMPNHPRLINSRARREVAAREAGIWSVPHDARPEDTSGFVSATEHGAPHAARPSQEEPASI